ncbi:hypothetical protein [Brevundimonas mediterranea]|uniref:hypothetical protein n=1 Tax=Brevundimonas mediterranea TaxID=74329 RepID=UPI0012B6A860|nr:hypothetical protein [Brevundimonas mediterranea]
MTFDGKARPRPSADVGASRSSSSSQRRRWQAGDDTRRSNVTVLASGRSKIPRRNLAEGIEAENGEAIFMVLPLSL